MDFYEFTEWLIVNKGFNRRSATDVISRIKRVMRYLNTDNLSNDSIEKLISNSEFKQCSMSVKSQLKRSILLYFEYDGI